MVAIVNQKWLSKYKNPPIWAKFGFHVDYDETKNGYQFSLKSENIEILPILSAANLKMVAIR
jgi:hypothetical protein